MTPTFPSHTGPEQSSEPAMSILTSYQYPQHVSTGSNVYTYTCLHPMYTRKCLHSPYVHTHSMSTLQISTPTACLHPQMSTFATCQYPQHVYTHSISTPTNVYACNMPTPTTCLHQSMPTPCKCLHLQYAHNLHHIYTCKCLNLQYTHS